MKRLNIQIFGEVQDVSFRQRTKDMAEELSLTGVVLNNLDGSVSIFAEGPEDKLETFLEWTKQGPDAANVEKHDFRWKDATGQYDDFRIIR